MKTKRFVCAARSGYILAGFVFLGTILGVGQAAPDPWLILVSGEKGAINSHTTRQELVRTYGAANVVDKEVDVGEGETEPGTVVFPKDPQRTIEIRWKDPGKKTPPAFIQIEGDTSRWKTVHNISLGTTLKKLERLNGRPFHLAGFGWDYSGTVSSWSKGSLAAELVGDHGYLTLRLGPPSNAQLPEDEQDQVLGDSDFSSSHPVMQKINPKVYQIIWGFPTLTK